MHNRHYNLGTRRYNCLSLHYTTKLSLIHDYATDLDFCGIRL
jgi:hypothetical protein